MESAGSSDLGKTKVVVVMGATGTGKSRLAIDLAAHFPVEVVNADAMQIYRGLDVLTNKVPLQDRCGVPHHLLGTADTDVDLTSRDFRTLAVRVIEDISSRGRLPVVVGGTNYYIQALFSPFLVDDLVEDMGECSLSEVGNFPPKFKSDLDENRTDNAFHRLQEIDPVAANRIHPNDHRKVNRYLSLYESSGLLPSSLFRGKSLERWGRSDNFRYDCYFLWLDASLSELDRYVGERVDEMINAGLLDEVYDVYDPNADYTRGLKQAIGIREFEKLFKSFFSTSEKAQRSFDDIASEDSMISDCKGDDHRSPKISLLNVIQNSVDKNLKNLLHEAIDEMKANTRRLVRRQRRRLNRLKTDFGWSFHYIDATEAFESRTEDSWQRAVVEPCVSVIKDFLCLEFVSTAGSQALQSLASRDLWTRYVCEACGNRVLRGAHEWDQHRNGRAHRKRVHKSRKPTYSITQGESTVCSALLSLSF